MAAGVTPAAILFPIAAALSGAQVEPPPVLHCYSTATAHGIVARREFKNADGHVVKEIFYTSSLVEQRPRCAEDTLRVQSIRTFEHDAAGRPIVERVFSPEERIERLSRIEYEDDEGPPVRRSTLDPSGVLRSETRWRDGVQVAALEFDGQGRAAVVEGELPADLQYAIAWGPVEDGWTCGLGATRISGTPSEVDAYVHLRNLGPDDRMARFQWSFDAELRDGRGRPVPERVAWSPAVRRLAVSRLLRAGEAAHNYTVDLRTRYGRLAAGWYQLTVLHPNPDTGRTLECGPLELQIK